MNCQCAFHKVAFFNGWRFSPESLSITFICPDKCCQVTGKEGENESKFLGHHCKLCTNIALPEPSVQQQLVLFDKGLLDSTHMALGEGLAKGYTTQLNKVGLLYTICTGYTYTSP